MLNNNNQTIKIFSVEDEMVIVMVLQQIIMQLNCQFVGFANNLDAAKKKLSQTKVDLILCDINLFGNMNGIEVGVELNKLFNTPVVFATGYSPSDMKKNNINIGNFDFIVKPYTRDDLKAKIEHVLQLDKK